MWSQQNEITKILVVLTNIVIVLDIKLIDAFIFEEHKFFVLSFTMIQSNSNKIGFL